MIGRRLGHYRILEQIGAGGMGVVYRARDEHLDRDVALKVLPPDTFDDDAARRRFRREALSLSKLNHPNIATVHDFDTQDAVDFLVVELIGGTSVDDLLHSGPLSEKEVLRLGQHLADGIAAAHQEGILHRDLKPANLRMTRDRWLKILDFGLAKAIRPADGSTDVKESTAFAGTLPYMAPEQLSRGHTDERTDIWSIGAVLYELATGQRPFSHPTAPRVASAILTERPPMPSSLNREVSPALEQIILKCLEKEPENRYQAAREISVDLRRATNSSSVAVPAGPRREMRKLIPLLAILPIIAVGIWLWSRAGGTAGRVPERIQSLAVLPLANLSGQAEQEYFSDGMTDALITELAQIQELTVISRTSVIQYKGTRKPMPQIAKELNVDAVVEGSVQRAGDRVAINVQLIDGARDTHLWAKNYQGNLRDALGLQREIASAIAGEIKATLTPQEASHLASRRPVDPVAYDSYLKGFHHARKVTREGLEKGKEYFLHALARDPNYAPAYLGLSYVYAWQGDWYVPNREALPRSREASMRAIQLDPSLAEAHTYLALMMAVHDYDWSGAEKEFRRAIELNPGSAEAHRWFAYVLGPQGRFESGLQEAERSVKLDPLSVESYWLLGNHLLFSRRYDDAIQQFLRGLELDPNYMATNMTLGEAYLQKGQFAEAVAAYERARDTAVEGGEVPPDVLGGLAYAHALAGHRAEAMKYLKELESLSRRRYVPPFEFAKTQLALGQKELALTSLEKSCADRNWAIIWIKVDPRWDTLRSEPRFQAIMQRMSLTPGTSAPDQ